MACVSVIAGIYAFGPKGGTKKKDIVLDVGYTDMGLIEYDSSMAGSCFASNGGMNVGLSKFNTYRQNGIYKPFFRSC